MVEAAVALVFDYGRAAQEQSEPRYTRTAPCCDPGVPTDTVTGLRAGAL